jgi:hypothetical protein
LELIVVGLRRHGGGMFRECSDVFVELGNSIEKIVVCSPWRGHASSKCTYSSSLNP